MTKTPHITRMCLKRALRFTQNPKITHHMVWWLPVGLPSPHLSGLFSRPYPYAPNKKDYKYNTRIIQFISFLKCQVSRYTFLKLKLLL